MVVKTLYYFVSIFFAVMVFLLAQDPYLLDFRPVDPKIAQVEMYDVQDHEISVNGVISITNAKQAVRYSDRDELYGVDALLRRDGLINSLRADKGILQDNIVYLDGDVRYVRNDGITFESAAVEYHRDKDMLKGKVPFVLSDNYNKTLGDSFTYVIKEGKIEANNIHATLETERR